VRGSLIIPFLVLLVFIGSYTANRQIADLIVTLAFGGLGYLMVRYGWPRAPLVLGFVLGKLAETYLFISVARYGFAWLGEPLVIALIVLAVGVVAYPYIQERRGAR
jgi:putative tricarboxylic transport membrane protein